MKLTYTANHQKREIDVASVEEAVEAFAKHRNDFATGFGSRDLTMEPTVRHNGHVVARIGYNGTIWPGVTPKRRLKQAVANPAV